MSDSLPAQHADENVPQSLYSESWNKIQSPAVLWERSWPPPTRYVSPHPSCSLTPPPASPTLLQLLWTPSSRLAPHAGSLLLPLVQTAPFASNTPTPNPMPSSEQFLPVFQISGKVSSLLKKSPLGVPTRWSYCAVAPLSSQCWSHSCILSVDKTIWYVCKLHQLHRTLEL